MSLLKQKKENDRVAAEAAAKAKEEAILRELAIHPVIKAGCGRDVRDAYFHGLVFAAIADDEKVDADERAILDGVAKSMGFEDGDVEEAISLITNMPSPDAKLQLIEECLCAIKDRESIIKLFYAQFAELWMTGEYDLGELKEYAGMFKDSTGIELLSARLKDIKMVLSNSAELNSALDDLAAWMGDDELKHFALHRYGDVTSRIEQSKKAKRKAAAEQKERERVSRTRAEFESLIDGIGEKYKLNGSMPTGWHDDVWECLRGFSSADIDWVAAVNSRLKALRQIPHCYAKLVIHGQERSRRKLVWKVVCMILVLRRGACNNVGTINDLLRTAMSLSTDGYNEKFECFVARSFSDVVTLS